MAIITLLMIGYIDFIQGYRFSFSIFYLLPVAYITWYHSKISGIVFSFLGAIVWFYADYFARPFVPDILLISWNSFLRLGFFLIVTFLLAELKQSLNREKTIARHDYLTNAWNRMAFFELAEIEIARAKRYLKPLTIVYIDLDNFKLVNDKQGHEEGDRVLKSVSVKVLEQIRKSDIFSRIGGDEFTLLLPETDSNEAEGLIERIKNELMKLVNENQWPITFSIGIVSFISTPNSVEEMINVADTLMYSVKNSSKNRTVVQVIE
jgi:diguanylate cyclase (GGDEF)-like protein